MTEKFASSDPDATPLSLEDRVQHLEQRLFEVMIEVEALRRERLADASTRDRYRAIYCQTSVDTHNAAGPYPPGQKVAWMWNGVWGRRGEPVAGRGPRPEALRQHEWAMLIRLGLSDAEMQAHLADIDEVSSYT
jgi:hypothetical protein